MQYLEIVVYGCSVAEALTAENKGITQCSFSVMLLAVDKWDVLVSWVMLLSRDVW